MGAKRLQLSDIDGRTIQVELTVIRPALEGTAFAANDVFLFAGIQEELRPGERPRSIESTRGRKVGRKPIGISA